MSVFSVGVRSISRLIMNDFLAFFLLHILLTRFSSVNPSNGSSLKWVRVSIPQYRVPGDMAQLRCDYDLGNDNLYSVKWYKDHEEFYRFVPRAKPEALSFKIEGITVDMSISDSKTVVLRSVTLNTSGVFRCEVSAEAPSFTSAQSEARMEVVYLPKEDPKISGVELQYQIGDEIDLNCTSGKSHPPSVLHWYINDKEVIDAKYLINYPTFEHHHGLSSSILGLKFVLTPDHFSEGLMRVKCVAYILPVLWQGERESAVQSLPVREMREALLLVKSSSSDIYQISYVLLLVSVLNVLVALV